MKEAEVFPSLRKAPTWHYVIDWEGFNCLVFYNEALEGSDGLDGVDWKNEFQLVMDKAIWYCKVAGGQGCYELGRLTLRATLGGTGFKKLGWDIPDDVDGAPDWRLHGVIILGESGFMIRDRTQFAAARRKQAEDVQAWMESSGVKGMTIPSDDSEELDDDEPTLFGVIGRLLEEKYDIGWWV
jgi:hypothetical protein